MTKEQKSAIVERYNVALLRRDKEFANANRHLELKAAATSERAKKRNVTMSNNAWRRLASASGALRGIYDCLDILGYKIVKDNHGLAVDVVPIDKEEHNGALHS